MQLLVMVDYHLYFISKHCKASLTNSCKIFSISKEISVIERLAEIAEKVSGSHFTVF